MSDPYAAPTPSLRHQWRYCIVARLGCIPSRTCGCSLRGCADQGLDPLAAVRVDIERYVRWLSDYDVTMVVARQAQRWRHGVRTGTLDEMVCAVEALADTCVHWQRYAYRGAKVLLDRLESLPWLLETVFRVARTTPSLQQVSALGAGELPAAGLLEQRADAGAGPRRSSASVHGGRSLGPSSRTRRCTGRLGYRHRTYPTFADDVVPGGLRSLP